MAVCLALAACADSDKESPDADPDLPAVEGEAPTDPDLTGIWLQVEDPDSLGVLVEFSSAGTFAMDDAGDLAANPAATGTYELQKDTITFTSKGSDECDEGDKWEWRAGVPELGQLHVVHVEEGADPCVTPLGTEWTLVRLSPSSSASADIDVAGSTKGRPPSEEEVEGVWLVPEEDSLLIQLGPDGSFFLDNEGDLAVAPPVLGTYELGEDSIDFTIDGGYACTAGDGWAWTANLVDDGLLHISHTKAAQSGNCDVPVGVEWTLVRVSPSSEAGGEITPVTTDG